MTLWMIECVVVFFVDYVFRNMNWTIYRRERTANSIQTTSALSWYLNQVFDFKFNYDVLSLLSTII